MAGSIETKAISASNLKLKLKLTEADLGNMFSFATFFFVLVFKITLLFRGAFLITNDACMEDNIDYKGNTIDVRDNVPSPAVCQDLCEKNDLCHLWSWVGHTVNKWVGYTVTVTAQKCHLKNKSAESSRRSLPRVISGKKNCIER